MVEDAALCMVGDQKQMRLQVLDLDASGAVYAWGFGIGIGALGQLNIPAGHL